MEIKGKVKVIGSDIQVSASFVKRELVVTTDEQYPQHILINFVQDKVDLLDKYNVGDSVVVGVNIRGREWVDPSGVSKYFNDIQGWKISADKEVAPKVHHSNHPTNMPNPNQDKPKDFVPTVDLMEDGIDDLPF